MGRAVVVGVVCVAGSGRQGRQVWAAVQVGGGRRVRT